jgi:hypothetical protein
MLEIGLGLLVFMGIAAACRKQDNDPLAQEVLNEVEQERMNIGTATIILLCFLCLILLVVVGV